MERVQIRISESGGTEAQMVLTLSEPARKKILAKTRKLRRGLAHQLQNPRAP